MAKAEDRVKTIAIPFPVGGVDKRLSYDEQAPLTAVAASNVRPDASISSRERGGSRPGLVKWDSAQPAGANVVRLIGQAFFTSSSAYAKYTYMSANGTLYRWNSAGSWTQITGVTLVGNRPLTGCDLLNKVYIANQVTTEAIVVWTPTGTTMAALVASAGTVPTKCYILARYRDRLIAAGDRDNPHVIYASKQGDPTDWDDTATGVDAAWTLTTAEAGRVGAPITALAPHGDDCMIVGCAGELWTVRSDPGSNGAIDNLSRTIGIFDYTSWCHDSEGNLWFISHNDGLYFMSAGCGDRPLSVSRERLPEDLLNLVRGTDVVTMSYDVRDRGLHIVKNGSSDSAWFVDIKIKRTGDAARNWGSFWPASHTADHYAMYQYHLTEADHTKSQALWGGSDGYIRHFDNTASQDDGSADITATYSVVVPMASPGEVGGLHTLECTPATSSGDIDVAVAVGNSMEEAADASASATYAFNSVGYNGSIHPRVRGNAVKLTVSNGQSNAEFAVESLLIKVAPQSNRR